MNSKKCVEGFCLFFLFVVVVSTSQTKWPCVFDFGNGKRFDLTLQNGNTSNSNQAYQVLDNSPPRNAYFEKKGEVFFSFYLCDSIENPFAVENSDCGENTQVCMKDSRERIKSWDPSWEQRETDDLAVGEGPARATFDGQFRLYTTIEDRSICIDSSTENVMTNSSIKILCPYLYQDKENNDWDLSLRGGSRYYEASYCPQSILITLYLDSACIGPFCCTYQDNENSFNIFSICAENTCPPLSGYSLTHKIHLNGADCLACKSSFDDAKCCIYSNKKQHEKVTYELSGTCPPESGSRTLVSEFPTTSIENCRIFDATRSSSSCCTYQDEKNSFNIFSLCTENTCPSLTGFSLTHSSILNGGDCSKCEPYFDDAKCCLYSNKKQNEKVTCELSGICPPKDGSKKLVGEFSTTSVEYCQVIQEFHASSSGKIESPSQPQGSSSDPSSSSPNSPSSSDSSSLYFFFAGFVVFFVVGVVLVLSYLFYFKQNPFQLKERQEGQLMAAETEGNSESEF